MTDGLVGPGVNVELVAFGALALAGAIVLLSAARHLYPKLGIAEEALETAELLTALIIAVLVLTGTGLILVGFAG
ncbi:hypothetical protein B2G88_15030 [Natronolimnobius baerhuensis]|uniref:Beta-ketoadipyl CoA thiolase n=1 Tax=Natronolimnobius baerhuensis TaxID=253108 RepID=A0A202E634_9EURY|nr:hypothetical protein B2G88_15030 [Natronolimnobius baerhuensis]